MFKLRVGVGGVRGLCGADRAGLLPGNSNLLALLKVAVWYFKLCPPSPPTVIHTQKNPSNIFNFTYNNWTTKDLKLTFLKKSVEFGYLKIKIF